MGGWGQCKIPEKQGSVKEKGMNNNEMQYLFLGIKKAKVRNAYIAKLQKEIETEKRRNFPI